MSQGTLIERIARRVFGKLIADVHTHIPAQVISYDSTLNTCVVQPCINQIRTEDPNNLTTVKMPVIEDVPVKQSGSGKCLFSVAPQVDSYGVLHVLEREIETWMLSGGIVDPNSAKQFDFSDAIFEPGLYPIMPDGDNGLLVPGINTDRIELRTRLGTTYVSVTDAGDIELTSILGNFTMEADGTITAENSMGDFSLDGTTGQFDANGNFTVDP